MKLFRLIIYSCLAGATAVASPAFGLGSAVDSHQSAKTGSFMVKNAWTPLIQAAHAGDTERVRELLQSKTKVNAVSKDKETALLAAFMQPRSEATFDDLNAYVNFNRGLVGMGQLPPNWSETDFSIGPGSCNLECLRLLIEAGANVNATDRDGKTTLEEAVEQKALDSVKVLIDAKAKVNTKDKEGDSPLSEAIRQGQTECVHLLLDARADPNTMDKSGMSPLMWAAATGNLAGYRLLVSKGANPKLKNQFGESVVTKAIGVIWGDRPTMNAEVNVPSFPQIPQTMTVDQAISMDRALAQKPASQPAPPARMLNMNGSRMIAPGFATPPNPAQGAFNRMMVVNQMQQLNQAQQAGAVMGDLEGRIIGSLVSRLFDHHQAVKYPVAVGAAGPEALKSIVTDGADVNARSAFDGATPLMSSIESAHIETAKVLLAAGADPQLTDKEANSPLQAAAALGDADMVNELLLKGADVNHQNKSGYTALHFACTVNPINSEKLVHAAKESLPGADPGTYRAVLRGADASACVKSLVDHKANLNAKTYLDETPLMIALKSGNADVASMLIEAGADLKAVDRNGSTVLQYAVAGGDQATVQKLIDRGANVNASGKNGVTCLMVAAGSGNEGLVDVLLSAGAKVSARAQNGWTALISAAKEGNQACVVKLLGGGADVNYAAPNGETALIMAAGIGHGSCVEALLKAGANVHAQLKDGSTPIILAGIGGDTTAISALLASGASVNESLKDGRSALAIACLAGHDKCAEAFISAGANINGVDKDHQTPLMIAAVAGRLSCVRLLLSKGADAAAKANGRTALQLANEAAHKHRGDRRFAAVINALEQAGSN